MTTRESPTVDTAATVNEILAQHPATVSVFNLFGIDACCGFGSGGAAVVVTSGSARMAALGYPATNGTTGVSPYDFIADYFRGATGMMKDLFRHKDKLLETVDMMRGRFRTNSACSSGVPRTFEDQPISEKPMAAFG